MEFIEHVSPMGIYSMQTDIQTFSNACAVIIFIDQLDEAPEGSCVVFSAHGIAPAVREEAKKRQQKSIDATCPLVTKVHLEVHRFMREGFSLILIGHKDHEL